MKALNGILKSRIKSKIAILLSVIMLINSTGILYANPNTQFSVAAIVSENIGDISSGDYLFDNNNELFDDNDDLYNDLDEKYDDYTYDLDNQNEDNLYYDTEQEEDLFAFVSFDLAAYDIVIEGDITITSATHHRSLNVLYTGNVSVAASLILENGHFTVMGTLNVENGGSVAVRNRSSIVIGGDLRIQSRNLDGTFGETSGRMFLEGNISANLVVKGDFYTQTTNTTIFADDLPGSRPFGTLELHGSFYQIGTNTSFINASQNFTIIFSGEGEQRVSFDRFDDSARLGRIRTGSSNHIYFATPVFNAFLAGDTRIKGDMIEINNLNSNNFNLYVEGNLVNLGNSSVVGNLTISGDMIVGSGNFNVLGITNITIGGDLRIQSRNADGTFGVTAGNLRLGHNADISIVVKGNLYTQTTDTGMLSPNPDRTRGTLELYGNFYQIGTNTHFRNTSRHFTIIFAGEGEQRVSFDRFDSSTNLGLTLIKNPTGLYFDTPVFGISLAGDAKIKGDAVTISSFSLNGFELYIDGNFIGRVGSHSWHGNITVTGDVIIEAIVSISSGLSNAPNTNITIGGDLRIQSRNADGTFGATAGNLQLGHNANISIVVKGNFYTQTTRALRLSPNPRLTRGTLELHGNFYQIGADTYFRNDLSSFTIVFAGEGEQHISVDRFDAHVILGNVKIANPHTTSLRFLTPAPHMTIIGDTAIFGDLTVNGQINVTNDATVKLDGNLTVNGSFFGPASGTAVKINGDLILHERLFADNIIITGNVHAISGGLGVETTALIHGSYYIDIGGSLFSSIAPGAIVIKGDIVNNGIADLFISRGVLRLYGDYIQTTPSGRLRLAQTAEFQLASTNQSITFPHGAVVTLNRLYIAGSPRNYTVNNGLAVFTLDQATNAAPTARIWTTLTTGIGTPITYPQFGITPASTVIYHGNGSTSGTVPLRQAFTADQQLVIRTNSGNLRREGFMFTGWNTSPNGSGIAFNAGQINVNMSALGLGGANVTLYAQWEPDPHSSPDYIFPEDTVWNVHTHAASNTEMFITAEPIERFGSHRDVTVGITRFLGSPVGNVYVKMDDGWQFIGQMSDEEIGINQRFLPGLIWLWSLLRNRQAVENSFEDEVFGSFIWERILELYSDNIVLSEEQRRKRTNLYLDMQVSRRRALEGPPDLSFVEAAIAIAEIRGEVSDDFSSGVQRRVVMPGSYSSPVIDLTRMMSFADVLLRDTAITDISQVDLNIIAFNNSRFQNVDDVILIGMLSDLTARSMARNQNFPSVTGDYWADSPGNYGKPWLVNVRQKAFRHFTWNYWATTRAGYGDTRAVATNYEWASAFLDGSKINALDLSGYSPAERLYRAIEIRDDVINYIQNHRGTHLSNRDYGAYALLHFFEYQHRGNYTMIDFWNNEMGRHYASLDIDGLDQSIPLLPALFIHEEFFYNLFTIALSQGDIMYLGTDVNADPATNASPITQRVRQIYARDLFIPVAGGR